MKKLTLTLSLAVITVLGFAQPANIRLQKCYGTSSYEYCQSMCRTYDGGRLISIYGGGGLGLLRTNYLGDTLWKKNIQFPITMETSDHGFVGYNNINDGESGINICQIVKINNLGNIQWSTTVMGSGYEYFGDVRQTSDGGFIAVGSTTSTDGDFFGLGHHGGSDIIIIKFSPTGNITWKKCFGGSSDENAYSVGQTANGGFIIGGETTSNNGNVSGNHGAKDLWILKLDSLGNLVWQKCFGGSAGEMCNNIIQTNDGGYILSSSTSSVNGNVTGNHGSSDLWVVKLDSLGSLTWQRCYGGIYDEAYGKIIKDSPSNYIIATSTKSNNGDVSGLHDTQNTTSDFWILSIDLSGNIIWQKCYGGTGRDYPADVVVNGTCGYSIAGTTFSNNGDVSGNHGSNDVWLLDLIMTSTCATPSNLSTFTTTLFPLTIHFNWSNVSCKTGYNIQYRKKGTLTWTSVDVPTNTYRIPATFTNYQFRVRTRCTLSPANYSAFSTTFSTNRMDEPDNSADAEGETMQIQLFPNPAENVINLNVVSAENNFNIQILNVEGKIVRQQQLVKDDTIIETPIDISTLPAGLYMMRVEGQSNTVIQRFVKN